MSVKITNIASGLVVTQNIQHIIEALYKVGKINTEEYYDMMHEVDKMKIIINDLLKARQIN